MSQQQTVYRHRLTTEGFDVSKTPVVLSEHLPALGWIIKDHLILVALVAYLIFSAFKNHDVKEYIYTTHTFLVWAHPSQSFRTSKRCLFFITWISVKFRPVGSLALNSELLSLFKPKVTGPQRHSDLSLSAWMTMLDQKTCLVFLTEIDFKNRARFFFFSPGVQSILQKPPQRGTLDKGMQ